MPLARNKQIYRPSGIAKQHCRSVKQHTINTYNPLIFRYKQNLSNIVSLLSNIAGSLSNILLTLIPPLIFKRKIFSKGVSWRVLWILGSSRLNS